MKNFIKAIIIILVIFIIIVAGWFIMYSRVNKNSLPDEVNTFTLTYSSNYLEFYDQDNFNTNTNLNTIYLNGEEANKLLSYLKLMTKSTNKEYTKQARYIAELLLDDSITITVYKDHVSYEYNGEKIYLDMTNTFLNELHTIYKDRHEDIFREIDDSYIPFSYKEISNFDLTNYDLNNPGYYETTDTEGNKILIITSGMKTSGCYGIEILNSNIDDNDNVTIKVHETNSSENAKFAMCTMALVYPSVVIQLSGNYQNISIIDTNNNIYNKLG